MSQPAFYVVLAWDDFASDNDAPVLIATDDYQEAMEVWRENQAAVMYKSKRDEQQMTPFRGPSKGR